MFIDLMRDKSKQMPVVARPQDVEKLRIWHCGYKTLAPVATFENLRALAVATFPDENLLCLERLEKLQYLSILHLPKVSNLSPLAKLSSLESLELCVLPSWGTSKRTVVESLEPLTKLGGLKHLSLIGVVPNDRSTVVLEQNKSLVSAMFHGYHKDDVIRFFSVTGVQNAHIPPFSGC